MSAPVTEQPNPGVTEQPNPGVAVPAAVGMVVAAVVAVFVVVALVVSLTENRLPTGPALPPPEAPVAAVSFDSSNRQARYVDVLVRMPADPYTCPGTPDAVPPLLASGILCSTPVHRDYDGTSDWLATAGFGPVADDLAGATAAATAKAFFDTYRTVGFGSQKTTLTDQDTDQVDLDGHQVALISGNVGYSVPGVPSTFDRVLVIALPLDDGSYAVYFSSRPNDTSTTTLEVLNESINTLSYP
jgi:hypothetical protein